MYKSLKVILTWKTTIMIYMFENKRNAVSKGEKDVNSARDVYTLKRCYIQFKGKYKRI